MSKINFYITPYPDECGYSFLCRCSVRIPHVSTRRMFKVLFGRYNNLSQYFFKPFREADIHNWFGSIWSKDYFFRNHSCMQYYSLILKDKAFSTVLACVDKDSDNIENYEKSISRACGYNKFHYKNIRYCPNCAEEDLKLYGEIYWHRLPQLPGIIMCPKHDTAILDSNVAFSSTTRHFIPASLAFRDLNALTTSKTTLSKKYIKQYRTLACDTEWLLNNGLKLREMLRKDEFDYIYTFERILNNYEGSFLRHIWKRVSKLSTFDNFLDRQYFWNLYNPLLRLFYLEIIYGDIKNYFATLL